MLENVYSKGGYTAHKTHKKHCCDGRERSVLTCYLYKPFNKKLHSKATSITQIIRFWKILFYIWLIRAPIFLLRVVTVEIAFEIIC